jgi:hypothetical protein
MAPRLPLIPELLLTSGSIRAEGGDVTAFLVLELKNGCSRAPPVTLAKNLVQDSQLPVDGVRSAPPTS